MGALAQNNEDPCRMFIFVSAGAGAGKTTIALNILRMLKDHGIPCLLTDEHPVSQEEERNLSHEGALERLGTIMRSTEPEQLVQIITVTATKVPKSPKTPFVDQGSLLGHTPR